MSEGSFGSLQAVQDGASSGERLSALMDGEWQRDNGDFGGSGGSREAISGFAGRLGAEDKQRWMLYHAVGDALRSDELAMSPAVSQQFSQSFAARFADEPVFIAPAGASAGKSAMTKGRRMVPSFAAAAAVATLAWVLVPQMHGGSSALSGAPTITSAANVAPGMTHMSLASRSGSSADWQRVNLSADRQLDPYLEAHQQFASDRGALAYAGLTSSEH